MSLQIWMIRHAESIGNQEQRMEGQASSGLSTLGQHQARQLAYACQQRQAWPTHIYCSPLRRAVETLNILMDIVMNTDRTAGSAEAGDFPQTMPAGGRGSLKVQFTTDIQEMHQGVLQTLTWPEAQDRYPDLCQTLESTLDWLPIPAAESLVAVNDRARRFVERLLAQHQQGDRLWIISHHGVMLHLLSALMGCDRTWGIKIPNTAVFEFWLEVDRWANPADTNRLNSQLWQIRQFNDTRHLAQPEDPT